nr:MAG TPA: hypothetical protein [Caudoviricetes sp.]
MRFLDFLARSTGLKPVTPCKPSICCDPASL